MKENKKSKAERKLFPTFTPLEHIGNFVEGRIGRAFDGTHAEAPILDGAPEALKWYKIPIQKGKSGDGSEYHIYLKKGIVDNLCIFFSGGGVAWNEYTAARPVTGGRKAAGEPNFYWNNLRPFTQIMNINTGITSLNESVNPFTNWSFVIITYSTGDFHLGNSEFKYKDENGEEKTLYFHGKKNFLEAMKIAKKHFEKPIKMLIAGDSAGGFAVPALADTIVKDYYPECTDITLLSDSSLLPYKRWKKTARNLWHSDEDIWKKMHSDNPTLDWYEALHKEYGKRFKYLYAGSTHDYLLSTFYNDIRKKKYETDKLIQEEFFERYREMLKKLKEIEPEFGFFIYNWRNILYTKGGTVHTAVRELNFYNRLKTDVPMYEWLGDAVNGKVYSVGMRLMEKG